MIERFFAIRRTTICGVDLQMQELKTGPISCNVPTDAIVILSQHAHSMAMQL